MNWKSKITAAALALFMGVTASHAASVTAVNAPTFAVGDTVSIDLVTSADTADLIGFQTLLSFDATALALQSIGFHSSFDFLFPEATDPLGNPQEVTAGTLGTALSGEVTLATFIFEALAVGDTTVTFGDAGSFGGFINDSKGLPLFDGVVLANLTITGDETTPNVVPLPASVWLLLGGVFGLRLLSRKRAA